MGRPFIDRTGQRFGNLTVISDTENTQILCRCDCGVEELFPRAITKPSYKGRLICSYCRGGICDICGKRIKYKSGQISATCSDGCAKKRHQKIEKERYHKIKHSEKFKKTRASYLEKLKSFFKKDPDLYLKFRARARVNCQKTRSKPEQKTKTYFYNKKRWELIKNDYNLHQQHMIYNRIKYDLYTDDDYKRIFKRERSYTRQRKPRE